MLVSPARRHDSWRQIANVLALVATIAVNTLASALPLNGQTTGEISDRFDVFFVPAGYVFGIWGLIYLGLIGFVVFQALPGHGANPRLRRVGYLFVLSCAANAAWLVLWHYELFGWTIVAMLILLGSLIAIYARLRVGLEPIGAAESWLVRAPFSVYLGWISVATIANATALLRYHNWNGWGIGGEIWTMLLLAVGLGLAAAIKLTRGDILYVLVLAWAFAGIGVKHAATPRVAIAAWAATALAAALLLIGPHRTPRLPLSRTLRS